MPHLSGPKHLSDGLTFAVAMAADAKDIRGFRLPFAIGAAVITVLLGAATAAWMSALLKSFHVCALALRAPTRMDQTADDSKDFICTARVCLRERKTQVDGRKRN